MKIKSIELTNNSFFGNLSIDFVDSLGNIMDNIVIAGENGCGKTQFLNIIYDFTLIHSLIDICCELLHVACAVVPVDEMGVV